MLVEICDRIFFVMYDIQDIVNENNDDNYYNYDNERNQLCVVFFFVVVNRECSCMIWDLKYILCIYCYWWFVVNFQRCM